MKTQAVCVVLAGLLLLAPPAAFAHRLVPDDGTHTTEDNAIFLDDPGLSQVVYHEVTTESNAIWIAFDAAAGDSLYWQLGIPAIAGLEDYRPTVALIGPGLPAITWPYATPEGMGGVILDTEGMDAERFDEHFTGTVDWIIHGEDRVLTQAGRYYLVGYHPDGTAGKF